MEYINLGKSDLKVSRICLGCMGFGDSMAGMHSWTLGEEKSRTIIKRALELGVNFFDTAAGYQGGTSEKYLGKALKDFAKREDAVVATKFFPITQDEIKRGVTGKEHIKALLEESLNNLGMDYVDLYIYHMWDNNIPIEEVMETLNELVVSGKVREIGISNCFAWQIAKANGIAKMNGWKEFISIQGHYNLLFREEEREMVPYCSEEGIALTPYSPLASGRLVKGTAEISKRLEEDTFAKSKYDKTINEDQVIIKRVAEVAEKRGLTKSQVALGWLLTKVTAPVVGATKIKHIEDAVSAVGVRLLEEDIEYIEEPYVPHKLVGIMANSK